MIKQEVEDFRDHKALLKRADEILTGLGLDTPKLRSPMYSYRCFFNEKGMPFAGAIFLHITAPIPVPIHYSNVGSYDEVSAHDCVIYTFGVAPR